MVPETVTKNYEVLLDESGTIGHLIVTLTSEGVIFDLFGDGEADEKYDSDSVWDIGWTAQEIVDEFFV